ncbi:glycosyltransferase, partial [Candidatus Parcubacteria bacterium]
MKIDLFSTRFGGPYAWGKQLAQVGNKNSRYEISLHHKAWRLLLSPFFTFANIIHSVIPITFHFWSKPYLLTIKGDFTGENNLWQSWYPKAIKRADLITVPSRFLKERLNLKTALVIPNAINFADFPIRTPAPTVREEMTFLAVSNFWFEEKAQGLVKLFGILNQLYANQRNFELLVVGDGKYLPSLKSQAKNNRFKTTFLGQKNARPYYYQADVLAYYSLHDNMPNVLLEAMAAGLPVLTNAVGAVSEFIDDGQNGFVAATEAEYLLKL